MKKVLSRRQFVTLATLNSILFATPARKALAFNACRPQVDATAEFSSALQDLPIIDVHCHIFNATDIPAYEFAERVIALEQVRQDFKAQQRVAGNAFTPDQARKLYRNRERWLEDTLEKVELVSPLVGPLTQSRPIARLLLTPEYEHELELLQAAKKIPIARLEEAEESFLKTLAQNAGQHGSYIREWCLFTGQIWGGSESERSAAIKEATWHLRKFNRSYDSESFGDHRGTVRFLLCMSRTRLENFLDLRSSFRITSTGGAAVRPTFFVPALVDFDFWINGPYIREPNKPRKRRASVNQKSFIQGKRGQLRRVESIEDDAAIIRQRTVLRDQMLLMGKLSATYPGEVQAFFPFCPWRQVHYEHIGAARSAPLALLETAIEKHGFIGVKLYPAMGFRPWNNEKADDVQSIETGAFPKQLYEDSRFNYVGTDRPSGQAEKRWRFSLDREFGRRLDDVLARLYRYCLDQNLPILVHAAPSNSSGGYDYIDWQDKNRPVRHNLFAEKGAIEYWNKLLQHNNGEFSFLRLNLGHSGFDNSAWRIQLVHALKTFDHVYADLSYFENMLGSETNANACDYADRSGPLRGQLVSDSSLWRKLMYGSDWYMMVRESNHKNYLDILAKYSFTAGQRHNRKQIMRSILSGNAARYLGFNLISGNSNYTRLKSFYESNVSGKAAKRAAMIRLESLSSVANEGVPEKI